VSNSGFGVNVVESSAASNQTVRQVVHYD